MIAPNGDRGKGNAHRAIRLPETEMTLDRLTGDEFSYGDSFDVFHRV
jgi:hypothetical protein